MTSNIIRAASAALFLAAIALPAAAQTPQPQLSTLVVSGVGEVSAAPDMATVSAGVTSQAETARDALTANNAAMEKVIAALKEAGIEARDIQTSGFNVQPQYVYSEQRNNRQEPPRIVGYQVSNMVTTRVRDLANLGATLDKLVSSGANQIHGISFGVDDDQALLDKARGLAMEDARRKAELYASAAGIKLVRILTIQEAGGFMPPQPMPFDGRMMRAEAANAAPIETGEQELRISVSVSWEIAPKE